MSAWTKFATQFFHNKQKNDPDYKFSQALKQASPLFKKMKKGGSSKKQRGGVEKKYKIENNAKVECLETDPEYTNSEICKSSDEIDVDLTLSASTDQKDADMMKDPNDPDNIMEDHNDQSTLVKNDVKTGMGGGKKSKKKSKKAGKKSQKKQKKAKKAGSKKCKK